MHRRLLLLPLCFGKNGCTALCFTICFGKTSGLAGRAATYGGADYGLPTPGHAIHVAIYGVAQCASRTSVCSSSKRLTGLLPLSTLRLGLEQFEEGVAVEQGGVPSLLLLFPDKAIPPRSGLQSQEMWVMRRAPRCVCAGAWRLGARGRRRMGPGRR